MATVAITADQDAVEAEIFIAAPPERVFEAITDPSQTAQWWGQQGMYRITEKQSDLRPGGKWSSVGVGADGPSFRVEGEYLEVDPPRLLVHTWVKSWEGPSQTIVRWELEPRDVHGLQAHGPAGRAPARSSRSGTQDSPETPNPQPIMAMDGSASWNGCKRMWNKARPSTRVRRWRPRRCRKNPERRITSPWSARNGLLRYGILSLAHA